MGEGPGFLLAHHLGRALQLTNILRDIDEDAAVNRLYLPREYLEDAGVPIGTPAAAAASPKLDAACRAVARLAHDHYRDAQRVLSLRPAGQLRAPRLMGAVYSAILSRMEKTGWAAPRMRVKIGKAELLAILLRHGFAR